MSEMHALTPVEVYRPNLECEVMYLCSWCDKVYGYRLVRNHSYKLVGHKWDSSGVDHTPDLMCLTCPMDE